MIAKNWYSFESLRTIIGEPLTVAPAFSWLCGCWGTLVPSTEDSMMVTPCKDHRGRLA
jgi:hypothetical protein